MNFFSKLFGGSKKNTNGERARNSNFTPSDQLMDEDEFWKIIERSKKSAARNFELQQEELANELRKLSPDAIIQFQNRFMYFRGEANTWELWGAIYIIHGGCSDDSFNDFREWVIGQGREFYYNTIRNPESLVEIDHDDIEVDWEGLGYVPASVFEEITGQDIAALFKERLETTGRQWDEDSNDLKGMFPKLCAKYPDNV